MSFKGKGLSYEAQEPAFLRKLRAQQAGIDTDRHERPIARPHRVRVNHDDDEGPTYVDEANNDTLSKEQYEALLRDGQKGGADEMSGIGLNDDLENPTGQRDPTNVSAAPVRSKQEVAQVGQAQKRRKPARVVGQSQDDDDEDNNKDADPLAKKERNAVAKKNVKSGNAKKPKAIKLSFGIDE